MKKRPRSGVSEVRLGAAISYVAVAFNAVAGLLYTPWLISSIGKSHYGLYTLSMSLVGLFLMDFGMSAAVAKYLSGYIASGRSEDASRFLGVVYKIYLALSGLVALVLTAVYFVLDRVFVQLTTSELATFRTLYVIVALYSVLSFPAIPLNGVLLSNERLIALRVIGLAQKVLSVLFAVVALLLGQGVFAIVAIQALVNLGAAGVKYAVVRTSGLPRADFSVFDSEMARGVAGLSGWVTVTQVAQRFIFGTAPSVLGVVSGSAEIALFGLASSLESYLYYVAQALNGLFLPRVSRMLLQEDSSEAILQLMVRVGRIQTYVVGAVVIGFACVGRSFVAAWLGAGYEQLYLGALLLMLPALVELPQEIGATALLATGKIRSQAIVYVVMALVSITLTFPLGRQLGAVGACAAVLIAYVVRTAGMNLVYSRVLQIDIGRFFKRTYGDWLLPAGISTGLGIYVNSLSASVGWGSVATKSGVVLAIYALAVFFLACDEYEKQLLRSIVGRMGF